MRRVLTPDLRKSLAKDAQTERGSKSFYRESPHDGTGSFSTRHNAYADYASQGRFMLTYLSAAAVRDCLPGLDAQIELARTALGALATNQAEMPAKVAVHPRDEALIEAMPAWWRIGDVAGLKWISAYPSNRLRHQPQVMGLIVLNDATTGAPISVLDAVQITLARTAAISGLALRLCGDSRHTVAVLGAGAQARAHISMAVSLGFVDDLRIFDRNKERAEELAVWSQSLGASSLLSCACASAQEAVEGASVVFSCASLGTERQLLHSRWVDAARLVLAIDEDVYLSSDIVRASKTFIVDDINQFRSARDQGVFSEFPDPDGALGEYLLGETPTLVPPGRLAVVTLGVGIADIIFAAAVHQNAWDAGIGLSLEPPGF
jgi:alanine dehydrogenase